MKTNALFVSVMIAASWVNAQTAVWNPAANPFSDGSWTDPANWTSGTVPDNTIKAVFNVSGALDCVVSNAASAGRIVSGDNGPGGTLVLTNGASLTVGNLDWSAVGYNNTSLMVVESGASATFAHHLWIGFEPAATGELVMNGGSISVAQMTGLGWNGGKGTARINGGTLNLAQLHATLSIRGNSIMDIGAGTVIIDGDQRTSVNNYINSGKIIGYGGTGSVVTDFGISNPGKTTITAVTNEIPPAEVVWNPAANPVSTGKWNEAANWTGGRLPGNTTKVVFNVPNALACQVTSASTAGRIVSGDGGPGGTLIVTNGAGLTVGASDWSAVGYNNTGMLLVELGASATFGNHLWIGFDPAADGVLQVNGGTVSVAAMFGLGWNGGKGTAHINGGTLNLAQWDPLSSINGSSVLNITGSGKVVIAGNFVDSVTEYVNSGKITANGGTNVFYLYEPGTDKTIIAAEYIPPVQAVWNPAANPESSGVWNEDANWTGGRHPGNTTKVVFNVSGALDCFVTNAAAAGRIVSGDNGPGGILVVTNDATLTVGDVDWSAVGYNNTATMVIESGSATFAHHLWIGFNAGADGVLIMNGGSVSVAQMTGLGWNGGKGTAQIRGGTLNLAQLHPTSSIQGESVLDVSGTGRVVITGDHYTAVRDYVAAGKITANDGSNVIYYFDADINKTIISAVMAPRKITEINADGGNITLIYQTIAGQTYHVESTSSLSPASWEPVPGSTIVASGPMTTNTFSAGSGTQKLYRTVSP